MTVVKTLRLALPLLAALLAAGCLSLPGHGSASPASPLPTYPVVVEEFGVILERTRAASFSYAVEGTLPGGEPLDATGVHDPEEPDRTGLDRFSEAIKDVRLAGPNLYWVYVQTDQPSALTGHSFLPIGAPGKIQVYSPYGGAIRVNVTADDAGRITSFVVEANEGSSKMRVTTTLSGHGR
ncbi:hypothetical protein AB0G04_27715 [Actinoplanes sp. NPDC023801]|uniref:hypothetical protein n=1 Tax=Actinoplanes sp. NPDC023801 TaxID=3154595 RepID=UPI0033FABF51